MKRFLSLGLTTLLCVSALWAFMPSIDTYLYYFHADNSDGVTIYYHTTDKTKHVAEVYIYGVNTTGIVTEEGEYSGSIVVPTTAMNGENEETITGVGEAAFQSATGLTSVNLPSTLTYVSASAFSGCTGLTKLTVNATDTPSCGENAFDGVDKTTCVLYVPEGCVETYSVADGWKEFTTIKVIGDEDDGDGDGDGGGDDSGLEDGDTFYVEADNFYYRVVSAEEKTVEITYGDGFNRTSFKGTTAYSGSISTPETTTYDGTTYSVVGIGSNAFAFCSNITSISIKSNIKSIGDAAFRSCTNLSSMTVPETVTELGDSVFFVCQYMMSVSIPSHMTRIPKSFFHNCVNLKSINIPSGVTEIDTCAFKGCSNLTSIALPEGVTVIRSEAFNSCSSMANITIPSGVKEIESTTFKYCYAFTDITLPEGITSVGQEAFGKCTALTRIVLPSTVTKVARQAFQDCSSLAKVYSLNTTPPTSLTESTFENIPTDCVLYVPKGSKEDYADEEYWEDFYKIVEIGEELSIETLDATDVTHESAVLNGTIYETYDNPATSKGFEYWTGDDAAKTVSVSDVDNEISATISSLTNGTTYTYRAYATTSAGTTYGAEKTFTTAVPEGIGGINADNENVEGCYTTSGQQTDAPVKGVNIVRMSDGTARKVLVK